MLGKLAAFEDWLTPRKVFVGVFSLLCALHFDVLFDPPYWDASMGAFPQGVWLAHHHFDAWALLSHERVFVDGGPNVYPFSVYPYVVGALYGLDLAPTNVFVVLHVASFLFAAWAASALFAVARRRLAAPFGVLALLVFVTAPLFRSLACQMNMDMPLVACTASSLDALDRRRFGSAWIASALALLIKPTAVILIGANLVTCALAAWRPAWCGLAAEPDERAMRTNARRAVVGHALLLAVFFGEIVLLARFAKEPAFVDPLGGWKSLFLRRLWVVPEFGLGLVAFLALSGFVVRRALAGRAAWIDVQCLVFLAVFVAFYGQYTNTLPRYFLQAYPCLIVGALLVARHVAGLDRRRRGRVAVLAGAVCLFHVVNVRAAFYPAPGASGWRVPGADGPILGNDGYILERSLEYRDDLRLNQDLARAVEATEPDEAVVVANWPLLQLLALPELGYVHQRRVTSSPDNPLTYDDGDVPFGEVYEMRAGPPRLAKPRRVVWALTPNTFSGPETSFLPAVDEVLQIVRVGRHRAFLVHRRGWE